MRDLLMEKDLPNGTEVRIISNPELNGMTGVIIGVATTPSCPGIQNFIVKPNPSTDFSFPNDIYPYECFVMPNCCLELVEEKKPWRAEKGGTFYRIDAYGVVMEDIDNYLAGDSLLYDIGNYFETEEEAMVTSKEIKGVYARIRKSKNNE